MARTPLVSILQKSYALAEEEWKRQNSNGQAVRPIGIGSQTEIVTIEKEKLQSPIMNSGDAKIVQRVAIIGAGLAGLTCAYRLKQGGIIATIYEASERVGGRCWTRRDYFNEGQIVERGGELMDTCHIEIQELAKELGLELDHVTAAEPPGTKPCYFFDGAGYSIKEVTNDFLKIYPKLQKDLKEVGETTLYYSFTKRGYELDHMSIVDYINEIVPGGIQSRFGKLLELAYTIEYGADASKQSALNLLYLLGFAQREHFQIYGDSDECFHIKGGNDLLPNRLAKKLNGQIRFNSQLKKIAFDDQKEIRLVFQNDEQEWEVIADKVILALPISILRTIDYKDASFRPLKKIAIEELGMGVNTKLHVQFVSRFWNELGNNGETFSDTGYQQTFESSRAQPGRSGILVNYTGGDTAAKQVAQTNDSLAETVKIFLDKLNPVLPGCKSKWNGLATLNHWLSNQWSKGAYSYWKVGQHTKFAGILGEREGNIFFAGEHTSIKYPGYLNGAVETGERAAQEILNDILKNKLEP
ncbi:FAD-dependent oxidoreductase [Bacillus sp. BRMEA1]|uniref:flavin monoamine oxidase family protein n=1 Tax=Neobacillus endophyticus TaxID=2738405 RepID=UPI0015655F5B|nr:NAD(P)/FAD-dependent oxidoreductase [Neobacillus endophyticus]NRD79817.1 FAD-dependent oxidoreductase [Neobacillus endophyticus]